MKATSIFGGVQVFNILITLVRGKVVAILLGPAGMGLNGLFLSGLNLVQSLTSLGIAESAVKDLALSHGKNEDDFNKTYTVFKSWIWVTALLGMSISILFAPLLSRFAFGDGSQTWAFMFLSTTFIFGALAGGVYTVLRATRKIKELAKANIYGSISGLLVTLPILYVWGIDGVMPSIIAAGFATLLVSLLFRKFIKVEVVELTLKEKFDLGKPMVAMGINMALSGLFGTVSIFSLTIFITRFGSLDDLGLYNAGNSIIAGYVGMIFTAMSADYFPRLSALSDDKNKWENVINQQIEILLLAMLFILPIIVLTVKFLIIVLLSEKFIEAADFIAITSLSITFKALLWAINFTYLSMGSSKLFLITQSIGIPVFLTLRILGFSLMGLEGLAIFEIVAMIIVLLYNYAITKRKYVYSISSKSWILTFVIPIILMIIYFMVNQQELLYMVISIALVLLTSVSSLVLINKKSDILSTVIQKFKK